MQQTFHTRNYSIRDFEEWNSRGELVLQPKFQRRDVWSDKARSYLMDTIIRGKPIPKIYMRQDVNPRSRRTVREIVDGQQRLRSVLNFLKDGFKISKSHHETLGGLTFSGLDEDTQKDILKYEFAVDLLQDMPDPEVFNIFARINMYSEKLKPQELRNSRWYGDFKSCVYQLAEEFTTFFIVNNIFSEKQVLRMAEAEFITDLLQTMQDGIVAGSKSVRDKVYKTYDNTYPGRRTHEKHFRETMDTIKAIFGADFPQSQFRAIRLLYPLFCAIHHMKFGLPKFQGPRTAFKLSDYARMKTALEAIDQLVETTKPNTPKISAEDRTFLSAYTVHWVHADKRVILTDYICKKLRKAIND